MANKIDYEKVLNPAQLEAVMTLNGPVLVIAGAGSGKTRTLVYRVARLVETGVPPLPGRPPRRCWTGRRAYQMQDAGSSQAGHFIPFPTKC